MHLLRLKFVITIFILLCTQVVRSQNISYKGQINTRHFTSNDFGSAGQMWTGLQVANGDFLFGNRQDILRFNGVEWDKINTDTIHTQKSVRDNCFDTYVCKLYLASNDRVYVGRDNNFGYLDYSAKGELLYYPIFYGGIKNQIGKVWNIFELSNNEIMFVAEKNIFIYTKDKKLKTLTVPENYQNLDCNNSFRILNGMFLIYRVKGDRDVAKDKYLYYNLLDSKLSKIDKQNKPRLYNIRGSFQVNRKWYIKDLDNALFEVNQSNDGVISWDIVPENTLPSIQNHASYFVSKYGNFLLNNTENEGLIVGDLQGRLIKKFNLSDDIGSMSVNYSFFDSNNNLWLCLGNGIQFYETGSPVSYLNKKNGVTSQIETIDFQGGNPILGTHSGILTQSTDGFGNFSLKNASHLEEIIFDIKTVKTNQGDKSLVIGYNGIYEFNPLLGSAPTISSLYAISFALDPRSPNSVFISLENGIGRLHLENGSWKFDEYVANAGGETVSLTYLNNKIYFSIRARGLGIYDLKTKKFSVKTLKQLKQDDQKNNFYIEQFKEKIYIGTANGLFEYNEKSGDFIAFGPENLLRIKDAKNTIHRVVNIDDEQLWLVIHQDRKDGKFEDITGWFEKRGNEWKWFAWPLASLKNAGLVFAIEKNPSANEVWIGAVNGLYILNNNAISKNRGSYKVNIDKLEVNGKPFLFNLLKVDNLEPLNYSQNTFKLTFHANSYSNIAPTTYSYKLEGFSDEWSQWSNLNFANFEKIPEGKYTFLVKARSAYGIESEVLKIDLIVNPPWYRTIFAYVVYFIALIFLIYFVVHLSTQRVKKQNQKLEETVQERTKEIAEQNHQLEKQKEEIVEKTKDILDSIHYAKRIQTTILPNQTRLSEMFNQHCVFYRPKDIVSGDFYWARELNDLVVFSAVDCTGHGVPGALVSIVGNNGLIRAVNEFKLTEPKDILDKLREIVVDAFQTDGNTDVKDGMDIALCTIDKNSGLLKFAGANNECLIIRNGELIELKPDKQPIGQFIDAKPFNQHEFQLEDGDCVYMTTDGYVDQFGGERMKKFKSKPFKALLTSIYQLDMQLQYKEIQQSFDAWKGDLDQVDDVCVFAIRYKKA